MTVSTATATLITAALPTAALAVNLPGSNTGDGFEPGMMREAQAGHQNGGIKLLIKGSVV